MSEQNDSIEISKIGLLKLINHAPGTTFQFEIAPDNKMSFSFLSKGINKMFPKLGHEQLKLNPRKALDFIHPDDVPNLIGSLKKSFNNLSFWKNEFRTISSNGTNSWFFGRALPEKLNNGTIVYFGTFQNISNRKEYEVALEQISFDISHILRRPVTSMLGLTSNIEKDVISAERFQEYCSHIKIVAEELDRFTKDLNNIYYEKKRKITSLNKN